MPRKVDVHDLELFTINTGEFYKKHLALVGKPLGEWLLHVQESALPLYCRQIEPVTASESTKLTVARNLMGYYRRHADETKALADSERKAEWKYDGYQDNDGYFDYSFSVVGNLRKMYRVTYSMDDAKWYGTITTAKTDDGPFDRDETMPAELVEFLKALIPVADMGPTNQKDQTNV